MKRVVICKAGKGTTGLEVPVRLLSFMTDLQAQSIQMWVITDYLQMLGHAVLCNTDGDCVILYLSAAFVEKKNQAVESYP